MPFTIQPFQQATTITPSGGSLDPTVSKLSTFEYNPDRAWLQASSQNVRGSITGGPSLSRFMDFGSEQKYLPLAPRPSLTSPVLPDTAAVYRRQLGAIDFSAVDPYSTIDQGADQAQQAVGGDPFAAFRGIQDFLSSKEIDIFGTGASGAPARAADYALAIPLEILKHLGGIDLSGVLPRGSAPKPEDDIYYQFHSDPRYWQALRTSSPAELDQLAMQFASRFVDTAVNAYAVQQLRAQFDRDRSMALGLSSGNDAVDYRAIKTAGLNLEFQHGPVIFAPGLQNLPVIGTQIVQFLDPITPEQQANWEALPEAQRQKLLGTMGTVQMISDLVGSLPAFSAFGTVLEVARAGTGMGRVLAQSYDMLLRGSAKVAEVGLAVAVSNWAVSAAWPEYGATIGREIDLARPISGSFVAAEVNQIGYFASGSWGAVGVGKVASRILGKALTPAVSTVVRGIGAPETALYQYGLGGALYSDLAMAAGIPQQALRLSMERLHLSYAVHLVQRPLVDMYEAFVKGAKVAGHPEFDELTQAERVAAASDELMTGLQQSHSRALPVLDVLNQARRPVGLFLTQEGERAAKWVKDQARTIDTELHQMFTRDYGAEWVTRQTGGYTEDRIKATVQARMDRLGFDFSAIDGQIHGEDNWAKMLRIVHQYEFDAKNGELAAAFDTPGVAPSREAGRLALVEAGHLFTDKAATIIAALKDGSEAEKTAALHEFVATIEGERWYNHNFRPRGFGRAVVKDVESIAPESVVKWIEEASPALLIRRMAGDLTSATADMPLNKLNRQLSQDGLWELAFKPTNEAGQFVSYVHTTDGAMFQTPWLDYPMSNAANIELGNRGRLMAKYDAIFRSFRTYRVAEFQRGLLYRNLTGGKYDLAVTPAQIESFNQDIMTLAAKYSIQPQTLGAVGEGAVGIGSAWKEEIQAVAEKHFGAGPYLSKTGVKVQINWSQVVADSYRQSLKLNFTAGLTSYMKSHFGPVGSAVALWSDIGYINFRFGLSPLFKLGEVEETLQLNAMNGVNPHGDPWMEQLFYRQGIGENHGVMTQEQSYDQLLLGSGKQAPIERQATAYNWLSLKAPETLAQKQAKAAIQARVEAFHQFTAGGNSIYASPRHALEVELAGLTDEAGNILPGMDGRAAEINAILDGQVSFDAARAKNHVGFELPPEFSPDPADLGPSAGYGVSQGKVGLPDWIDPATLPEDRGLWHATTDVDGVMNLGLKSGWEIRNTSPAASGLGGSSGMVSLTTDWVHADTIRERLAVASAAARNEATNRELVDYWLSVYDDAGMEAEQAFNELAGHVRYAMSKVGPGRLEEASRAFAKVTNEQELIATMDEFMTTGTVKYELVKVADTYLERASMENGFARYNAVVLVADAADVARANPASIGIVKVGIKRGTAYDPGPDAFEIRLHSDDLWVLDQRILDKPLATDKEGLLNQLRDTLRDDGQTILPGFEAYHDRVVQALAELDGAKIVPTVDNLAQVPGTPEFLISNINEVDPTILAPSAGERKTFMAQAKKGIATVRNPIPFKQHQALLYRIEKLRREFPSLVRASGMDGFETVMHQLGVPERDWLPFLMTDRELAQQFSLSGHPDDLAKLLAHGGDEQAARGYFDQLYASDEWSTVTALWAIADRTAADDAFRVHFFNPYRSALERSLNHPLVGIYPLSWALKAAREWLKFLYDNHTIQGLSLGMTPAVAINHIIRAQNATFAQTNDTTLEKYIGLQGPFASSLLIFNLILPGDWSSIPFPASRTVRDLLRKGPQGMLLGMPDQIGRIGLGRDARLFTESAGEIGDLMFPNLNQKTALPWTPITGGTSIAPDAAGTNR